MICLSGLAGRGVTSVVQRCARVPPVVRQPRRARQGRGGGALRVSERGRRAAHAHARVRAAHRATRRGAARVRACVVPVRAGGSGDAESAFELSNKVPETVNGARRAFLDAVRATIGPTRRVAVFIDDATAVENPLGLAWMVHEREIPTGCQVICGARGGDETLARELVSERPGAPRNALLTEDGIAKHAPDRLLRAQIAGLAACLFDSVARPLTLRPMSYAERKLYVAKHARERLRGARRGFGLGGFGDAGRRAPPVREVLRGAPAHDGHGRRGRRAAGGEASVPSGPPRHVTREARITRARVPRNRRSRWCFPPSRSGVNRSPPRTSPPSWR